MSSSSLCGSGRRWSLSAASKSPEDTVLRKLEWFEAGGRVSDRQWRDVLGVLRLRGPSLDHEYLDRWARALRVVDLLERARREAS